MASVAQQLSVVRWSPILWRRSQKQRRGGAGTIVCSVAISNLQTRERAKLKQLFEDAYERCRTAPTDGVSFTLEQFTNALEKYDLLGPRYESQKRRDWNTFCVYLRNHHHPSLTPFGCSHEHVLKFLRYMDQFGETKVHFETCVYFGDSYPLGQCPCPLKQAWDSLEGIVDRLHAAFEENGGSPEMNPFGARMVSVYLMEVRDSQERSKGIGHEKKKRSYLNTAKWAMKKKKSNLDSAKCVLMIMMMIMMIIIIIW